MHRAEKSKNNPLKFIAIDFLCSFYREAYLPVHTPFKDSPLPSFVIDNIFVNETTVCGITLHPNFSKEIGKARNFNFSERFADKWLLYSQLFNLLSAFLLSDDLSNAK